MKISATTEIIAKKAHTEVVDAAVAPSCTETGLTSGKHCSVCSEILEAQNLVAALGHTEKVVKGVAATCISSGLTDGKQCSVCNETLVEREVIAALGHDERVIAAVAPTCTEAGLTEGKYCYECGETLVAQSTVPMIPHTYDDETDLVCNVCHTERDCLHPETVVVLGKAATCTESGLTDGRKCTVCDDIIVSQESIPSLGHTEVKIPAKAATCTEPGATEGKKCYTCGAILVQPTVISAKGHTEKILPAVPATCTSTGLSAGKQCSVCNEIIVKQEATPMLSHNYSEAWSKDGSQHWHACTACGDKSGTSDHAYITEVENSRVNATCEKDGKYTLECVCGATKDVTISATGHSYSENWTETETQHWHECTSCGSKKDVANHAYTTEVENSRVDATCTANGSYIMSCVCGATKNETIEKIGHSYTTVVTDPTCIEAGYTTHTCESCGDTYKDSTVNAKGHTEEILPYVAPTCTESGLSKGMKCAVCGEMLVEQEEISALGHDYSEEWSSNDDQHWHECFCGDKSEMADHVYTNACDATCDVCQAERVVEGHKYDHACDPDCNECGEAREVGEHEYDDDHDADCNACGAVRLVILNDEFVKKYDVLLLANKESLVIDFAENVNNAVGFALIYSVDGVALDGSLYTITLGNYTDEIVYESFIVTVSYVVDGEEKFISYTYKLGLHDSSANRLANGDFENGLDGWTVVGNIGSVSSEKTYWNGEFGMDGEMMFSAYAPGATEDAVGILTSSTFKLGGSGFVTFKLGAMRDENYAYIDVVDAESGEILARYYNGLWERDKSHCTLIAYKADLSAFIGREVFFRISDNAASDYGLFFVDSFITYYENEPMEGFNMATPVSYNVSGTIYDVFNGGFEMGNVQGWWNDGEIGVVTNANGYWGDNIPYGKDGEYLFTGVESFGADTMREGNVGALTSSIFEIGGTGYISFKLGGGGNELCYVQIIDAVTGEALAIYRQQAMNDAVLIQYVADLSAYIGRMVRIQVVDNATGGWGCVSFDNVVTYYPEGSVLPEGLVANNLLAIDKSALEAELELEVFEQGDFTLDSFNAYLEKLAAAKEIANKTMVSQDAVDAVAAALTEARLALAIRPIEEIADADKDHNLISGNSKEINLADYINTNGLSGITYAIEADSALAILSEISDGKFTITAGDVTQMTAVTVSITVYYNGTEKLTVELAIQITNDLAPTLNSDEFVKNYDVYVLDNKSEIVIDLSENVDNSGNLALIYSVNGVALEGALYTVSLGSYTDEITYDSLIVTVSYVANGEEKSISYTYKLGMYDSTENRLANGDFENGLDGWTVVGNIGSVSSEKTYWYGEFGMDGEMMFSAYAPGATEAAVGILTSSTFKLGGSGFITFKIGAMRDENYVYVDVVDSDSGEILARYYNGLWENDKSHCTLIAYKADLSAFIGREVFFRISDNADSGYGLFFADSFVTYYENEPMEGFNMATSVSYNVSGTIYDVFNGGFEMGNVQGWWNNGEIGLVTNANGFWGDNIPYGKDGEYLFTGVESFGADTMREGNRGALTSSVFEIGGTGYISFKLGGGENALCYVQVIDAVTGEILARYHQQALNNAVLIQYVADLSAYIGRTARIQVVDQAASGWGCVSFDSVVTYYPEGAILPEGITANDIKGNLKYTIENGSFESGNIDGWTMNITEAGGQNTLGWVLENEIDAGWYAKNDDTKDGRFLFTFAQPGDINCENSKGTLQSSTFSLKQGSFVSFKFGAAGGNQNHDVYIELCRADGSVIARFYNDASGKINTRMNSYFYQYEGAEVECFFRVVDNSTGDYGCLVIDDFRVNLDAAPEGYIAAIQ